MVKRWHVPPVIGRIQSGVPTIEVVAAADYDALARECDLLNYDVNDAVKKNVDHLLRIRDLEMALGITTALNREGEKCKHGNGEDCSECAAIRAARKSVKPWSRRRCHCGCKNRATHRGCGNGVGLVTGCQASADTSQNRGGEPT